MLLADTGAGSGKADFDLILDEDDCVLGGGLPGYGNFGDPSGFGLEV
jgi:hypothetical protein